MSDLKAARKAAFSFEARIMPAAPATPTPRVNAAVRNVIAPLDGFWPSGQSHPWLNDLDPNYLKSYTPSHVL